MRGLLFDQITSNCKAIQSTGHIICIFIKFHVLCHDHQQDYCSTTLALPISKNAFWIIHHVFIALLSFSTYVALMRHQVGPCSLNTAEWMILPQHKYMFVLFDITNLVKIHYSIIIQRSHKNTFQRSFLIMQEKWCFLITFLFPKFLLGIT